MNTLQMVSEKCDMLLLENDGLRRENKLLKEALITVMRRYDYDGIVTETEMAFARAALPSGTVNVSALLERLNTLFWGDSWAKFHDEIESHWNTLSEVLREAIKRKEIEPIVPAHEVNREDSNWKNR